MTVAALNHDEQWLEVSFDDGTAAKFLGTWLRDNIGSGRHVTGGQRTFDINLMPEAVIRDAVCKQSGVEVSFGPDELTELFDESWLRRFVTVRRDTGGLVCWAAGQQIEVRFADYNQLRNDPLRLLAWLRELHSLGFALLENVPTEPGSIFDVVDLFGFVRETNYGPVFDVRVEHDPANLAFTSRSIGMHTDNPYRDPTPGLQLLHCLENNSDGGANQLCDGFAVAENLRNDSPHDFELLSSHPVRFHFRHDGEADLDNEVPIIELDALGGVRAVRYNARSVQPFELPNSVMADYYRAYRKFGRALHDPSAGVEFTLKAGQLMALDNQRILHGRSAYQQGSRHLQGCYADKDSLRSRIRILDGEQRETS